MTISLESRVSTETKYGYGGRIKAIRETEYPHLGDTIYLDHAGATPYPVSIIQEHCKDLATNLLSNPHSHSPSSIATGKRVTAIRRRILQFFNADPDIFDVVFVANATAGIKLVAEGFDGSPNGFQYHYLRDAHTSLVGASRLAVTSKCLSESEVDSWLKNSVEENAGQPGLLAYPAQSNFNGRRFPLGWPKLLRERYSNWYCLLDAASFLTTTPLDLSDLESAPDFVVMSFYKIFGYPDLGALIVRRDVGHMLVQRRYFGGGTRAALTADLSWSAPHEILHESLEDGTLPFHTILALEVAFKVYARLFGSQINVAQHAASVTRLAYTMLSSLRHANGKPACKLYSAPNHGPIIAFNLLSADGSEIGFVKFEKLSSSRGFAVRTGGMCNPGGVQHYLDFPNVKMERLFKSGKVCGDDLDLVEGKNIGVIRVSFGACSTMEEVYAFVEFLREFYVENDCPLI